MALPTGVVTFLFTDVVGSSSRWDSAAPEMGAAIRRHDELIGSAVSDNAGHVVKSMGDGIMAAFGDPADAVSAALAAQAAVASESWPAELDGLQVRMGVHTGPVEMHGDDDYLGPTVNRAARLEAAGHGGQILVSAASHALAAGRLDGVDYRDLGEHHLRGLTAPERVFQVVTSGLAEEFPPLKTESTPTNLPAALQTIIGRDDDLKSVTDELEAHRLVTVVGAGGAGKTTLATEAARRVVDHFPAGVWLVELAGLNDGSQVATEILGAARKPATAGRDHAEVLVEQLAGQQALLLLDNCEHLRSDVAGVVSRLLRGTEGVTVLATSREPLDVSGESVWRIPVLSLPEDETTAPVVASGAGALFAERARSADPGFALDDDNAATVARMCRQLDGLPLAIELACARLRSMSLDDLDRRLDDRFRILRGGSNDDVPHHRTLRDTVAWSYDLLNEPEQQLYRHLSVFAGGFDLEAAEALADHADLDADVLDGLDHLVAQSLVQYHDGRYRMLETIRQFAHELLADYDELHDASRSHLAWLQNLARTGARELEGKDQPIWMARFRSEIDNIRSALSWALEHDPVAGSAIATALTRFFWMNAMESDTRKLTDSRSFLDEGYDWATRLLDAAGDDLPPKRRARLQSGIGGLLCVRSGRFEEATNRLSEARTILEHEGDTRQLAWTRFYDGVAGWGPREPSETIDELLASLALHVECEDRAGQFFASLLAGLALGCVGRHDESRVYGDPTVEAGLQSKVPTVLAHSLDSSAFLDALRDEVRASSFEHAAESLEAFRGYGNYACITHALAASASALARVGDRQGAGIAVGISEGIRDHLSMIVAPYEDRSSDVVSVIRQSDGVDVRTDGPAKDAWDDHRSQGRTMAPDEGIDWTIARLERAGAALGTLE